MSFYSWIHGSEDVQSSTDLIAQEWYQLQRRKMGKGMRNDSKLIKDENRQHMHKLHGYVTVYKTKLAKI